MWVKPVTVSISQEGGIGNAATGIYYPAEWKDGALFYLDGTPVGEFYAIRPDDVTLETLEYELEALRSCRSNLVWTDRPALPGWTFLHGYHELCPVCPVCGLIPGNKHKYDRCVIAEGERQRKFDRDRLARWRDDRTGGFGCYGRLSLPNERPTISTVITCAEDVTDVVMTSEYGEFVLVIGHSEIFRGNRNGKGFMPRVYRSHNCRYDRGRWVCNFNLYDTFEEAVEKGTEELRAKCERDNQDWAEFEAKQNELRAAKEAENV